MSQVICPNHTSNPLPTNHFAILFEGAWIFSPADDEGTQIRATCPILTNDHVCAFGRWENNTINQLGNIPIETPVESSFIISTDVTSSASNDFSQVFGLAAEKYPFVYMRPMPPLEMKRNSSYSTKPRTVFLPVPSQIRAAGALISAEVGGPHKGQLFGGLLTVKRNFVTFLFIYEYYDSLNAYIDDGKGHKENVSASNGSTPHILFRISPNGTGMSMFGQEVKFMEDDESCLRVHAMSTFEMMRQAARNLPLMQNGAKMFSARLLDIGLCHQDASMTFDCGDSGLSAIELGLAKIPNLLGRTLPACASGSLVVGKS